MGRVGSGRARSSSAASRRPSRRAADRRSSPASLSHLMARTQNRANTRRTFLGTLEPTVASQLIRLSGRRCRIGGRRAPRCRPGVDCGRPGSHDPETDLLRVFCAHCSTQQGEALVEGLASAFDEAVGVADEHDAGGQRHGVEVLGCRDPRFGAARGRRRREPPAIRARRSPEVDGRRATARSRDREVRAARRGGGGLRGLELLQLTVRLGEDLFGAAIVEAVRPHVAAQSTRGATPEPSPLYRSSKAIQQRGHGCLRRHRGRPNDAKTHPQRA